MKKISNKLIMEKESVLHVKQLLHPWQILKPEDDTGIDLVVWPYLANQMPAKTQILIQMKSTKQFSLSHSGPISIQLESIHINGWRNLTLPVVIILDDQVNNKLYHKWISEFDETSVASPTVTFNKYWNYDDYERAKNEFLRVIYPAKIKNSKAELSSNGEISTIGETDLICGVSDMADPSILSMIDDFTKSSIAESKISELRNRAPCNNELRLQYQIEIACLFAGIGRFAEALYELREVIIAPMGQLKLIAEVLAKIINNRDKAVIAQLQDSAFVLYLQFNRSVTSEEVEILINDKKINIETDNNNCIIMPSEVIQKLSVKRIGGESEFEFYRRFGVVINHKVLHEYSYALDAAY